MHLSFILAVVAAFKLTVSMPVSLDTQCPATCDVQNCCPNYECWISSADPYNVSMSSFHSTPWLTGVVGHFYVCGQLS
ncbi:hypothetical protein EV702DRAFT_1091344 [Suillus placidus]|uniref:Hydrophobin n=1 Tax=Suillus placidus TaxID=48579 RepID=A0A9P6ZXQ0_9AGAM|nr:hypothetical protein EV702DRAFT_1091344 [Suillus placidus]